MSGVRGMPAAADRLSVHKLARVCRLSPSAICSVGRDGGDGGRSLAVLAVACRSRPELVADPGAAPDHELVRHGVYRTIRHPMYAAILLFGLAQGLLLENWLCGWSGLATFAVMYFVRVPHEERMMCEFFGETYRDYMRQSGRIFPRIRNKSDA